MRLSAGATLRELRRKAGLSQRQVAARLGIDFTNLSRFETDQRTPDAETLRGLAEVLGGDSDLLFCAFGLLPPDLAETLASDPATLRSIRELVQRKPA